MSTLTSVRPAGRGVAAGCPVGADRPGIDALIEHVQAAAQGCPAAWEALHAEFQGLIASIARRHRLSDADVDDVAQATWLRLLEHIEKLRDPARIAAWLSTTARRESLRVIRERGRVGLLGDGLADVEGIDERPIDATLLTAERDHGLRRSLSRLAARDQRLLTLLVTDERPDYDRISARLQMPVGSIGPTRSRALGRLRAQCERDGTLGLLAA